MEGGWQEGGRRVAGGWQEGGFLQAARKSIMPFHYGSIRVLTEEIVFKFCL